MITAVQSLASVFGLVTILALVVYIMTRERKAGAAIKEAEYVKDVAEETKRQADVLVEHGTDADVIDLLHRKAADQRRREAEGNG